MGGGEGGVVALFLPVSAFCPEELYQKKCPRSLCSLGIKCSHTFLSLLAFCAEEPYLKYPRCSEIIYFASFNVDLCFDFNNACVLYMYGDSNSFLGNINNQTFPHSLVYICWCFFHRDRLV